MAAAATGLEEIGGEESAFVQEDVIAIIKEVHQPQHPIALQLPFF